ncbi:MAG: Uma2 family endonuclease [Anaerolineae bacterium]|nr:Uma2 family endonuclease [Anaerolineae bacterium]
MALKPIIKEPVLPPQTVEEFEVFLALPENHDRLFELIDGEIVEKTGRTEEVGVIAAWVVTYLTLYAREDQRGYAAVAALHRPGGDLFNARQPDVSFVRDVTRPIEKHGAAAYLPDLCVEIQSPDDTDKQMADKAAFYLANGSKMVWLVYPSKRLVEVLTATDRQLLGLEDTLSGGEVLPGFSVAVKQIFLAG